MACLCCAAAAQPAPASLRDDAHGNRLLRTAYPFLFALRPYVQLCCREAHGRGQRGRVCTSPSAHRVGGVAAVDGVDCGLEFQATASGVVLGPSNRIITASPDTNADCVVNLSDFIYFAGVYQSDDCCCDFDCNGVVNLSDFITFASHYQHRCP